MISNLILYRSSFRRFLKSFTPCIILWLCLVWSFVCNEVGAQTDPEAYDLEIPQLGQVTGAIRNGFQVPRTLYIPLEQVRAIGWLATGDVARFCTATIISTTTIITARHCFEDFRIRNSTSLSFNLNLGDLTNSQVESFPFQLSDVILNGTLDIALIEFRTAPFATLNNVKIFPINRAPIEDTFYDNLIGYQITAAGYGATYEKRQSGLYFASVKIELINSHSIVVNGERRQGICTGDSGGPLIAPGLDGNPTILAVVSKGDPCCAGIDQITRLDPASSWIDRISGAIYATGPILNNWPKECAGISRYGSCSENSLRQCMGNIVTKNDCGSQYCDYDIHNQNVTCIAPTECLGIPLKGQCLEGNILQRCVRGLKDQVTCDPNSLCQYIENGDTPACVNQGPVSELLNQLIPNCIANEQGLITEASEARFVATSSCQQHHSSMAILGLFLLGLSAWCRRVLSISYLS